MPVPDDPFFPAVSISLAIFNCERCHGHHEKPVEFKPLSRASGGWTHYALCPTTGEPIFGRTLGGHHADDKINLPMRVQHGHGEDLSRGELGVETPGPLIDQVAAATGWDGERRKVPLARHIQESFVSSRKILEWVDCLASELKDLEMPVATRAVLAETAQKLCRLLTQEKTP